MHLVLKNYFLNKTPLIQSKQTDQYAAPSPPSISPARSQPLSLILPCPKNLAFLPAQWLSTKKPSILRLPFPNHPPQSTEQPGS